MRTFKSEFFKIWNSWLVNEPKAFTKAGNMKSPGYALAINWISLEWENFDFDLLSRSFDNCDITSPYTMDYHNQLKHFIKTQETIEAADIRDESELAPIFPLEDDGLEMDEDEYEFDDDDEDEEQDEEMRRED